MQAVNDNETQALRSAESYVEVAPKTHRILFTRGDELMTPTAFRGSFERAMERSLVAENDIADEYVARAFAVSVTANACTEYLATTTAGVPLKVTDPAGNDEHASPIGHFLTIAPNLIADVTRSAMVFGRFYLRKVYNPSGYPTGLKYLNPLTVREVDDGRGRLAYYELMLETGEREKLRPQDVIYKQVFDPRPFGNGLSKFEAAWLALNIEQSVSTYAAAFFVNGAQPDGFLTFTDPLSDDEYEEAKREWQKNHKGAKNGHRTAVMPGGATWTATSSVPKDLAMIELKRAEREDICAVFEVDPILVGLKDAADPLSANSTYSSAEIAHLRRVTLPFLKMIVLPALNDQWAQRDFEPRGYFTLTVDESAIPALVDAQLVKSDTAKTLTDGNMLDYAESRKLLGYGERETGYLIRKPDEALALWMASGLTLNALHTLVFGQSYLGANGEVVLLGGQLYPVAALAEVAAANVEKLKAPPVSPFGLSAPPTPALTQDVTVTTPQPLQLPPARADDKSAFLSLSLANNDQIYRVQEQLKQQFAAIPGIEWQEPDTFHITLVYCDSATDDQLAGIAHGLSGAPIAITSKQLGVFENDTRALHLVIDKNPALLRIQKDLYQRFTARELPLSEFSKPTDYKPHVTLCYLPEGVEIPDIEVKVDTFSGIVDFGRDDYKQFTSIALMGAIRSGYPLEIAVSFAGNQFVRYARRTLSDALTALRIKATWVFDDDWRLTLARTEQWTANALAALMRTADYAETKKVDARLVGFVQRGDAIYARLEGAVESLQKAVGLDLRAAGLSAETSIDGVLLCTIDGRADELPTLDFPLVLNNVSIYTGTDVYHAWALRAASTAQAKELANAENVLRRKGREHGFTFEALAGTDVETWVRSALDAGCELDDLFAVARGIQAGEITVRAYPETRDGFVSAVTELFMAAQNETTDRRNFAAQFRVQLRRAGLTAFRDGMNKVNYNPESYSPQELATFREWLDRQSGYVTGLGFELFKGGGIQANEVANRVRMWADISLNEIYYQGIAAGSKTQRMLWKYTPGAEHCDDCPRLNGQVHTMEEWIKSGYLPGNGQTECKQGCRCGLEPTDDPVRGTF